MDIIAYVNGRGGSPEEADRYRHLFPDCHVVGVPYTEDTPQKTGREIHRFLSGLRKGQERLILIANSIGAFFCMHADLNGIVSHAYFISPILDMEKLILAMLAASGYTEEDLETKKEIPDAYGNVLSWEYLSYVRDHKPDWAVPTEILYGSRDEMTDPDAVSAFARSCGAGLCTMEGGEHWFHTDAQLAFLDDWLVRRVILTPTDYAIRPERPEDYRTVENLIRESFWNVYRPGCLEHYVIHVLRDDPAFVKELDVVMEKDGTIIGQNMFMRTFVRTPDGTDVPVLTMGPICIAPEFKRSGYGKALLDASLQMAADLGYGAVLFEGNVRFYGKSGFDYARRFGIFYHDMPSDADQSFFLCRELKPGYLDGVTGVYETPHGYYVSEEEADAFDRTFLEKVRLKLPGQLFG